MPSLESVFDKAASGMSAQSIRINTLASNLANAGNVSGSEETTYHAKHPVFKEVKGSGTNLADKHMNGSVRVTDVIHSTQPLEKRHDPKNPLANEEGYIYLTDVNPIDQMTNMIAASREYQANIEMMNVAKQLVAKSLRVINEK